MLIIAKPIYYDHLRSIMDRKYPPFETLDRIKSWCDRQERAHSEVRAKLFSWGVHGSEVEQLLTELISENYLNEGRFATAFARGRFRIKNWGWIKIVSHLKAKGVSDASIRLAKQEIEPAQFQESIDQLIERKSNFIKSANGADRYNKLLRFGVSKGYSYDEVKGAIKRLLASN